MDCFESLLVPLHFSGYRLIILRKSIFSHFSIIVICTKIQHKKYCWVEFPYKLPETKETLWKSLTCTVASITNEPSLWLICGKQDSFQILLVNVEDNFALLPISKFIFLYLIPLLLIALIYIRIYMAAKVKKFMDLLAWVNS